MSAPTQTEFSIRDFRSDDQSVCRVLYVDGLVGGTLAENDTALDLDDIDATYMRSPGNHFWVAQNSRQETVAMIGVQHYERGEGEIRRMRVRADHRNRGIGSALIETALRFCLDNGYLKVTLDTYMDRQTAIRLFEKHRYKLSRTRQVGDREILYFYFDLYERPRRR